MSGLQRREYKRTNETASVERIDSHLKGLTSWDEGSDLILKVLASSNPDLRLSALRALNQQLSSQYMGEDLEDMASSLVSGLANLFTTHYASRAEHDEAFTAACNLALQFFSGFEVFATTIIENIFPTLADLPSGCDFRFWALPFLAAFSFPVESTVPGTLLSEIINLLTTKSARGVRYTPEVIIEGIRGVNLLLSVIPVDTIVADFMNAALELVDRRLLSKKPEVVLAALDTLLVLHDALVQHCNATEPEDSAEAEERLTAFIGSYRQKFIAFSMERVKSADQKMIKTRCAEIVKIFDGKSEDSDEITLNSQRVLLSGFRNVTVVNAIRRVSASRFEQQITANTAIHQLLGITLKSKPEVEKFKKDHRAEIQQSRVTSKRANEKKRAGQRKKKEAMDVEFE
jgi:hypothetical protein